MKPCVKIPREMLSAALDDLERPHDFAAERLGFFSFRQSLDREVPLLLCSEYHSIPDDQYVRDPMCGGRIGGQAIQAAMGRSFRTGSGQMWVHTHGRCGHPGASGTDRREGPRVVQSCANAQPKALHAWAVISEDGICGQVRTADGTLHHFSDLAVIGWPMVIPRRGAVQRTAERTWFSFRKRTPNLSDMYSRQGFLGPDAQNIIARAKIGLVGLGGGGSHLNQQFAHLGFQRVVLCDAQRVDSTNLNRLIGATVADVRRKRFKTEIAGRVFRGVQPSADLDDRPLRWEEKRDLLRQCDLICGAIDGFAARRDLEAFCRTHFIPLVDVGMTVLRPEGAPPEIRGQVILSMPGALCMKCLQFLTPENLAAEAQTYDRVPQAQVVWPNGVLASSAVGYVVGLLPGWSGRSIPSCRPDHRGSVMGLAPSNLAAALDGHPCKHFPLSQAGDAILRKL